MIKTNDWLQIIEKQILYSRMSKNADTKPDTKYFYIFNEEKTERLTRLTFR